MDDSPLIDVRSTPMAELLAADPPPCLARVIASLDEEAYCGFGSQIPVTESARE